jgi:hypothetical protein
VGVKAIGGRLTVCPIQSQLRDDGAMLQERRTASNSWLNHRYASPILVACQELAATPRRDSNAAAARREIVGNGFDRSPGEDLFQAPAEVPPPQLESSGCQGPDEGGVR